MKVAKAYNTCGMIGKDSRGTWEPVSTCNMATCVPRCLRKRKREGQKGQAIKRQPLLWGRPRGGSRLWALRLVNGLVPSSKVLDAQMYGSVDLSAAPPPVTLYSGDKSTNRTRRLDSRTIQGNMVHVLEEQAQPRLGRKGFPLKKDQMAQSCGSTLNETQQQAGPRLG